jgi:formylglycine-generating enzyme required for sulfatase activity
VSAYRLDKYEVTVGRFRQFLSSVTSFGGTVPAPGSGKHVHLNGGDGLVDVGATPPDGGLDGGPDASFVGYESGWNSAWNTYIPVGTGTAATWDANLTTACTGGAAATWTPSPGTNENLPINCVGWYAAYAFCIWDGGFLPSEAEWELAAAGGSEQRNYAWGSASPGTGSQYAIYGCDYPLGNGTCFDGGAEVGNVAPVGTPTLGVGRWGQLDLGGNLGEYVLDSYLPYVTPCVDCVNLAPAQFRLQRGAGFPDNSVVLVSPFRVYGFSTPFYDAGMRCARPPE